MRVPRSTTRLPPQFPAIELGQEQRWQRYPNEVASLVFYPSEGKWVEGGAFTKTFEEAFASIQSALKSPLPAGPDADRKKLVLEELSQGATTLVYNDLKGLSAAEKSFVGHMLAVAKLTDTLFATQTGAKAIEAQVGHRPREPRDLPP